MGEYGQVPDPQPAVSPAAPSIGERPKLYRSSTDRWIAGVCGGIAEHLGISSGLVRLLMVLAVLAGPGVFVYGFFWVMTRPDTAAADGVPVARARKSLTKNQVLLVIGAAVLIIGLGWGGPAGQIGRHLGFLLPVVAVAVGAFLAWSQLDANERSRWAGRSKRGRVLAVARPVVGVVLATVGVVALATQGQGFDVVLTSALAAVAVLVGATVIALPWVVRMWQGLQAEQTERIRATERADIAAHLHDSVLQTLALVQRRADDPATVIRLARSQERELREWLYADQNRSSDSLASAVTTATHDVEDEHGIPIELVVTGDRPMDDGGQAMVKATREALLNAVRHGSPPVSVYVEVGPTGVEAFVRDHGPGFEMSDIGDDRLGVRESILGRMRRHGGAAKIRRLESGTEIELTLPPLEKGSEAASPSGSASASGSASGSAPGSASGSVSGDAAGAEKSAEAQPTGGRPA
jgi:signal transduction histidine kinase/phage shock protein PspC (stress-responsive transcriptional regulator)